MLKMSFGKARAGFPALFERVTKDHEIVIIGRRSGGRVAMISADDLESLVESVYLVSSPKMPSG